ncbi:hypothetical protein ACFYWU_23915 [Streptomyces chrestomyceticus]|uniref:hypothetical protein n=1 Tax=Streptomyces chrestomyceticus TaxID=68185 RepID=UPI00367862E2
MSVERCPAHWEPLRGDALAAGETAREVRSAGAEWVNNTGGPNLPDFRFEAGPYDAEMARLARD